MVRNVKVADAVVVGGGIHGCSAALNLALRNLSVIVLEKDHVARHASGVNAGGVRRLGRDVAEVPLAQAAWELWQDMPALVDGDCGYRRSRYLKVARTEQELADAQARVGILNALGYSHEEVVDRHALREFLPAVADHCLGALHVDGDGAALPFRTTLAFRRRAESLGVDFIEAAPAIDAQRAAGLWRITTPSGIYEAPIVINAAGAWGGRLAAQLGDIIPLEGHAPMLVITQRMPHFAEPVVGALGAPLSFKQFANGTVLIGGGVRGQAFPDENRTRIDMAGLAGFLKTARDLFPIMRKARIVRAWAGIEGYTPDNLPVISRGSQDGVVHVFGFSAHGFQLAPAVGRIVASLALGEAQNLPIKPFRADRFQNFPTIRCC